ncbi:DNA replication/repair protein RecF [Spirochaeta africana]|uniref:DNA replication and repair protein RecF n=1 Tax=Spirochaeta africana (strain ATCC 700263 / DSM 8902 / Z-7692) TaxID=889378 RepID=H9UF20_SPIAZ|nr:DNA replication and repair protein RecF [Spirochaeta africana]AFG36113.1 recF protein [Spirochaeta africana DSM 8902]
MGFSNLRFYQFRNIANTTLRLDSRNVCFVGRNGQGKTNALEAIYLLCYGSSFRTRQDALLVHHGSSEMALVGTAEVDERTLELDLRIQNNRKQISVDGNPVQDRKEMVHNIPCIVFCHDDIEFVSGAPDRRRWFFNQTMSMAEPQYIDYLRSYNRILKSRNQTLKDGRLDLLDVYDSQLAETGLIIQQKRRQIVQQFNLSFQQLFREISELPYEMTIDYRCSWDDDSTGTWILHELRRRRDMDLRLGTTTSGPHRDKLVFVANGMDFTTVASTGQLRLLGLILRVAQARYLADMVGLRPILLLDDVLLELDPQRRKSFMRFLPAYLQAFYTFLPDEEFSQYISGDTLEYRVQHGQFELFQGR